jgi:hypothetical protein
LTDDLIHQAFFNERFDSLGDFHDDPLARKLLASFKRRYYRKEKPITTRKKHSLSVPQAFQLSRQRPLPENPYLSVHRINCRDARPAWECGILPHPMTPPGVGIKLIESLRRKRWTLVSRPPIGFFMRKGGKLQGK